MLIDRKPPSITPKEGLQNFISAFIKDLKCKNEN